MKSSNVTQKQVEKAALNKQSIDYALDVACLGMPRPEDVNHGHQVVVLDKGFVYAGNCTVSHDVSGEPWLLMSHSHNVTEFGCDEGLGGLRTGPRRETKTYSWETIYSPMSAVICYIESDHQKWFNTPEQENIKRPYDLIPHMSEENYRGVVDGTITSGPLYDAYQQGRRFPIDMDAKITVVDKGFVFVGRTFMVFDHANRPWVYIKDALNINDYGAPSLGELRNGPVSGTKTYKWGDILIPLHAFSHFILADRDKWGFPK